MFLAEAAEGDRQRPELRASSFELQAIASDAALSHFRRIYFEMVAKEEAENATTNASVVSVVRKPHEIGLKV